MTADEARAFLAAPPQKDGRYLAMMVPGAEAMAAASGNRDCS
jgi:hypothetical protein